MPSAISGVPPACARTCAAAGGFVRPARDFRENGVLGSKRLLAALDEQKHRVHGRERAGAMRDDHDDSAARANALDGAGQRLVALGVEVGVRLVEHHEEGIAKQRARQTDALALARRQACAVVADVGVVALGQAQDHVVHAGGGWRRR